MPWATPRSWDRPLDQTLHAAGGDPFTNRNPSYQIAFYMQHGGVPWGILTNGHMWRLYHKDSAHKLDHYYEVDLLDLATSDDPARFLYFYCFFRRRAFDDQPMGLGAILRESQEYARGLGDSVKAQVFSALRMLAQGFLDYRRNGLSTDPTSLAAIYDASLILLYRLLFTLYAEARGLLPARAKGLYAKFYGLCAIKEDVKEAIQNTLPPRHLGLHVVATVEPAVRLHQ